MRLLFSEALPQENKRASHKSGSCNPHGNNNNNNKGRKKEEATLS
jgi:hypothetical protein